MPLLFVYLSELYNWRGALLITAGICLHLAAGGALLRPVFISEWYESHEKEQEKAEIAVSLNESKLNGEIQTSQILQDVDLLLNRENTNSEILDIVKNPVVDRMAFLGAWSKSTLSLHSGKDQRNRLSKNIDSISLPVISDADSKNKQYISLRRKILIPSLKTPPRNLSIEEEDFLVRGDGSVKMYRENNENSNQLIASIVISQTLHKPNHQTQQGRSNFRFRHLLPYFQPYFILLTEWRFIIFCLVGCLDLQVRLTPASFIVVHAQTQGLTKDDGAALLVIFAVTDTCIRPISGESLCLPLQYCCIV